MMLAVLSRQPRGHQQHVEVQPPAACGCGVVARFIVVVAAYQAAKWHVMQ